MRYAYLWRETDKKLRIGTKLAKKAEVAPSFKFCYFIMVRFVCTSGSECDLSRLFTRLQSFGTTQSHLMQLIHARSIRTWIKMKLNLRFWVSNNDSPVSCVCELCLPYGLSWVSPVRTKSWFKSCLYHHCFYPPGPRNKFSIQCIANREQNNLISSLSNRGIFPGLVFF